LHIEQFGIPVSIKPQNGLWKKETGYIYTFSWNLILDIL